MIDPDFRTVLRGFLLVGGIIFVVWGAIEGTPLNLGLGSVATVLGAVGLWWEWRTQSEDVEERENI